MEVISLESHAQALAQSEDYRVLRRLPMRSRFGSPAPGERLFNGLCLDTETTGLGDADRIIELSMIPFTFNRQGQLMELGEAYNGFEDPGEPLSEEVRRLTGIDDAQLAGQHLDDLRVNAMIQAADLLIAHNASFDRPKMEARFPSCRGTRWGCTLNDVDWAALGFEGHKLGHLMMQFGWFFDGHRAENDVRATLELMAQRVRPDESREASVLRLLMESAHQENYRIWAVGAPFEVKDTLKARGYRWNAGEDGRPKAWHTSVSDETALRDELDWLCASAYGCAPERCPARIDVIDSRVRHSQRLGEMISATSVLCPQAPAQTTMRL